MSLNQVVVLKADVLDLIIQREQTTAQAQKIIEELNKQIETKFKEIADLQAEKAEDITEE